MSIFLWLLVVMADTDDRVAGYYLKRAIHFLIEDARNDWTGVKKMDEK